jgi:uncharacterized protein YbjT (DUF2867 family)
MKVLLTGATGYIGKRLLPVLIDNGHHVVCAVRDKKRFAVPKSLLPFIDVIEIDLLNSESLNAIPYDIDIGYYLIHSMSSSKDYQKLEKASAINFREAISKTKVTQVIYLSGIVNDDKLSQHLTSRQNVENELAKGNYAFTCLRAGIIIGSGSASFEIIRDLVEKLPVMITPRWLNTKCQPIGVSDVIHILINVIKKEECYNQSFDIGGPDILSYKEMLLIFAKERGLKRWIATLPIMTPRLSSYWLYFVTSTSYRLAVALVDSMKVEVICSDDRINHILDIKPLSYRESLRKAFARIQQNEVVSSWKDALTSGHLNVKVSDFINVPEYGCFKDTRSLPMTNKEASIDNVWRIGGQTGWYYANWLWRLRGFLDRLSGGVGLRRGRTHRDELEVGDALDFWRVFYANKDEGRLLLFAEMKLPGEAWLEFKVEKNHMIQTATFRPKGLWGRLYWYSVYPFHGLIFIGMLKSIVR